MTYLDVKPMFLSWVAHYKPLSASTINQYNLLIYRLLGNENIDNLTTRDLQDRLIEEAEVRDYSNSSQVTLCAAVKMFCKFLQHAEFTKENLGQRLIYPRRNRSSHHETLTEEEIEKIIVSSENIFHKTVIALLYDTGARVSAIVNLNINDVDIYRKSIVVKEKGNITRSLPISDRTSLYLEEYLKLERWKNPGTPCLFSTKTGSRIDRGDVGQIIRRVCERVGINKRVTPHTLRHSRATNLIRKGVPITHVAALLGHKDIRLTFQTYTHLEAEDLRNKIGA